MLLHNNMLAGSLEFKLNLAATLWQCAFVLQAHSACIQWWDHTLR